MKLQRAALVVFLLGVTLYAGSVLKLIFAPLVLAIVLALVILPLANRLEKWGVNRLFSSLITVMGVILLILGLGVAAFFQLKSMANISGDLENSMINKINKMIGYLPSFWAPPKLDEVTDIEKIIPEDTGLLGQVFGDALTATTDILSVLVIIPIFIFFVLFYRARISSFLEWIDSKDSGELRLATKESKEMVQKYLSGLGLIVVINATIATIGLHLIGIEYALVFGVLSALLVVIPYIGTFVGAFIPIAFAFLTKDAIFYGFAVMALYAVLQFVESNFISPVILGNSVNVNPFASILALLVMSQYWGIIGMVIAVPLVGVVVILLDHSETFKSINLLLKNHN